MKICLLLIVFFASTVLSAQSTEQKAYEKAKNELSKINKKALSAEALLNVYHSEIDTETEYVNHLTAQISGLKAQSEGLHAQLDELNQMLEVQCKNYSDLLFFAYKTRHARQAAAYFWAAADYNSAYRRFIYVRFLSDFLKRSTQEIKALSDSVQNQNYTLNKNISDISQLSASRADIMIELHKKVELQKKYSKNLTQQKKYLAKELERKKQKADALRKSVQKTVVSSKTNTVPKPSLNSSFSMLKGKLKHPVNGIITSTFGEHKHSVLEYVTTKNDGIEYTVSGENDVKVVADGLVVTVLTIPGSNTAIIVKHDDNFYTVYSNLVKVTVRQGQKVTQGDNIGKVFFKTSAPDSGIFNFQLWHGNDKLNPKPWLVK